MDLTECFAKCFLVFYFLELIHLYFLITFLQYLLTQKFQILFLSAIFFSILDIHIIIISFLTVCLLTVDLTNGFLAAIAFRSITFLAQIIISFVDVLKCLYIRVVIIVVSIQIVLFVVLVVIAVAFSLI